MVRGLNPASTRGWRLQWGSCPPAASQVPTKGSLNTSSPEEGIRQGTWGSQGTTELPLSKT